MNTYVKIDGLKYHVSTQRTKDTNPNQVRKLLDGTSDVTWGPGQVFEWKVVLLAAVTPDAGFGTPANLEAAYAKKETLSFEDMLGNAHTIVFDSDLRRKDLTPIHDDAQNVAEFKVVIWKV